MRKSKKTLRNKTKVNSKKKISSRRTKRSSRRPTRKSLRKSKKRTKSKLRMKGGMREEIRKAWEQSRGKIYRPPHGEIEFGRTYEGLTFEEFEELYNLIETEKNERQAGELDAERRVPFPPRADLNPKHGSENQRKLRQEIYKVQKETLPTIDYLFDESCESEEDEELTKATWIKRFQGTSWKELYREKPIIVIMAHGILKNRDAFSVPRNTQLIHNERSGNLSYNSVTRYGNGIYTFYLEDVFETIMNPEREDLYLFEDDGITRKPPFYYNAQPGSIQGKEFSVACQKLYREGDIINNIVLGFSDSNAFKTRADSLIWNPFNKENIKYNSYSIDRSPKDRAPADVESMTGIYIFNHPDGKTKLQELKLAAIMAEAKSPSADLEKWFTSEAGLSNKELADAMAVCEDEDIEELGDIQILMEFGYLDNIGFSPPTLAKIKKAAFGVSPLLNLLQKEDTHRDYIGDRQNPRHFGFNIQGGITDLKTIMEVFGEGTYYILSCKVSSSSNVEERELERQISKKRQFPPEPAPNDFAE